MRELSRSSAKASLDKNQSSQDVRVNRLRHPPRVFQVNDQVFVIKYSQSTGKLDPGMRGPYRVTKVLRSDRYELKLLSGARGKTTQAAAQYMVPWKGEWCPESCTAFFENDDNPDDAGEPSGPPACPAGAPVGTADAGAAAGAHRPDGASSDEDGDETLAVPASASEDVLGAAEDGARSG